MKRVNIFIGILFIISIISCKSNIQPANGTSVENFEKFHNKFYYDSIFQLSRIMFPLPGADSDVIYGDEKVENQENDVFLVDNNKLYWKKKGWKYIKAPVKNNEFVITLEKEDSIMREQIRSKETELVITLEFSLVDNKWMLSYYSHEWY